MFNLLENLLLGFLCLVLLGVILVVLFAVICVAVAGYKAIKREVQDDGTE